MKYFLMTMGIVFILGFGSARAEDIPCYDCEGDPAMEQYMVAQWGGNSFTYGTDRSTIPDNYSGFTCTSEYGVSRPC